MGFRASTKDDLWVKSGADWKLLTYKNDRSKFLFAPTIHRYGVQLARAHGIADELPLRLPAKTVAALQMANNELGGAAAVVDSVELQDLGQTAKKASHAVHRMETTFTDAEIDETLGTMHNPR